MVKVFNTEQDVPTTKIIEETLDVRADGSVAFRARRGKGSGKPVEIAGDQFDTFVGLMNEVASRREELAKAAQTENEVNSTESTETDSE